MIAEGSRVVRRLVSSFAAVALVVLVAACSGTPAAPSASGPQASAMPAGTYASKAFKPTVTFTVPGGWDNPDDAPDYLRIRPAGSDVVGIHLFRDPVAASQDKACPSSAEPGVGGTSSQLATWIRGLPGLLVSDPKIATIGGLRGVELDIGIKDGWTESCPFANGSPTVPLFVGQKASYRWIVAGSERLRIYLLDVPTGGTVVVDVDAFEGSLIDQLLAQAAPIVQSLSFAGS
jgi:hypothetical protein